MNRQTRAATAWLMLGLMAFVGCTPTQPFFLHEDGDLSHYLDQMQEISYPDVDSPENPEAMMSIEPLTVLDPEFDDWWDLQLEEAIAIALNNSKVIRNVGQVSQFGVADGLLNRTAGAATVFDPAITASNTSTRPNIGSNPPGSTGAVNTQARGIDPEQFSTAQTVGGVEDALAAFDAQAAAVFGYGHQDIQNNLAIANSFTADVDSRSAFDASITKRTATGGSAQLSHRVEYSRTDATARAVPSDYTASMQVRIDHPLLRGRGAFINRIPIVLARINEDISVADFEIAVRNLILDVENTYWDLQCAYRNFETAKIGRDAVQRTWLTAYEKQKVQGGVQQEAQSREQYLFFRAQLESALGELLETEARLRWLLGLAPTDNRLIRPIDEPVTAELMFDWNEVRTEALYRSPELRQQKWRIKQRELELANARNMLLPAVNVFAQHSWTGVGDQLISADRRGNNFPAQAVGSTAWDNLTEGDFQSSFVGLEFLPPAFGARREHARIRNAELSMKREQARLEDMELQAVHLLSTSIRGMALNYRQITTNLNRWAAADAEIRSALAAEKGGGGVKVFGRPTTDVLLDAQRRRALAQSDYYRVVCEYNKAIADLHFRKGSLMDYNAVQLTEGPWPQKAYFDALEKARQRDASHYLNYGWTRPGVVSRGPVASSITDVPLPGPGVEVLPTPQGAPAENPAADQPGQQQPGDANGDSGSETTVLQTTHAAPVRTTAPHRWGDLGLEAPAVAEGPLFDEQPMEIPADAGNPLR